MLPPDGEESKPAKPSLRELTDKKRAGPKRLADVRVNPAIAASFSGARAAAGGGGQTAAPPSPTAEAPPSPGAKTSSEDEAEPAAVAEQAEWGPKAEEQQPGEEQSGGTEGSLGLQAELSRAPESASDKVEAAKAGPEGCSASPLAPNTFNLTASTTAD